MSYTAAQWRPLIKQETGKYANTPGGAPPWQVVEGLIDLESGGDPTNVTDVGNGDVAVGLGQITTRGTEYDLYRQRFPNGPTDLTDPNTNMKITVLGLDYRQEQGVNAEKANQPHALSNWFVAAAAYFGAGSNAGITNAADRFGTTGFTYVDHIKKYMRDVLGLSAKEVEAIGGSTITDPSGGLGTDLDYALPGTDTVSSFFGTLADIGESFVSRGVPFFVGILLLVFGAYRVAKA